MGNTSGKSFKSNKHSDDFDEFDDVFGNEDEDYDDDHDPFSVNSSYSSYSSKEYDIEDSYSDKKYKNTLDDILNDLHKIKKEIRISQLSNTTQSYSKSDLPTQELLNATPDWNQLNWNNWGIDDITSFKTNLINKVDKIKKSLNKIDTDEKKVSVSANDIDYIAKVYHIDSTNLEHRDFILEILNEHVLWSTPVSSNSKIPVYFIQGVLLFGIGAVTNFLNNPLTEDSTRELLQTLALIKLEKIKPLSTIARINGLPFAYTKEFLDILPLEKEIEAKLTNCKNFKDIAKYLNSLHKDMTFTEEGISIYSEQVFPEILKIALSNIKDENLFELINDTPVFNLATLQTYTRELGKIQKREAIQIFSLLLNNVKFSPESYAVYNQKEVLTNLLQNNIYYEDVKNAISVMPSVGVDIDIEKVADVLEAYNKDTFLVFNRSKVVLKALDSIFENENQLNDVIISYFIIKCFNEKEDIKCKLINSNTIFFSSFNEIFYLEKTFKKILEKTSLENILEVIHNFKKDKIFSKEDEFVVDKIISKTIINDFSYNQNNKEILLINEEQCVFNEKIISQLDNLTKEQLLELFLFSNKTLLKDLSGKLKLDNTILNISEYSDIINDKLKHIITESDISSCLDSIEQKSNTLIQHKKDILMDTSIVLDAKEDNSTDNYIIKLDESKEIKCISFNEKNCSKALYKTLNEDKKQQLISTLFLSELLYRDISLYSKGTTIKIHDNCSKINEYSEDIIKKLIKNISEEDIDLCTTRFLKQYETKEDSKFAAIGVKKLFGLKPQAIKHTL